MSSHDHTTLQSMIPFVKRAIQNEVHETINARDLHANLEVGKDFTSWVKAQIKRAHLVENEDFITFTQKGETATGGYRSTEYFLIIDAAKHVAMMTGTEKGREIRAYFIEAERRLREGSLSLVHNDPILSSIQQSLVAIAEAQHLARQADAKAEEAKELALRALKGQMAMTLRYYRYANRLTHQLTDKMLGELSRYLRGYCSERGIPVSKEPVVDKAWGDELRFPVSVIDELLPGWLARYHGQLPMSGEDIV